jgi:hypothetical protein
VNLVLRGYLVCAAGQMTLEELIRLHLVALGERTKVV